MHRLWRAADQEGAIPEGYITKTRDKKAALLPPAMDELGNREKQEIGRWANNRVENSYLPFGRRERAMLRLRQMEPPKKLASVHASLHNHFASDRHLVDRQSYKLNCSAALAEWQSLTA